MCSRTTLLRAALTASLLSVGGLRVAAQNPPAPPEHQHHATGSETLFPPREASGTAWVPDDTPMYGAQFNWRGWEAMAHGVAFGQYLYEPGFIHRTGGFSTHQVGVVNWGMLAARRPLGAGRVGVRGMLS